ncbi:unnamed protein product [Phytophthora lilii]|uniref:Unnamed protein product n=1 Tax=Phytophthora lilii TaxID=2077276 RepID=A0A9W6TGL8_9STRA|nr:unnamed protein product [Phytophthora lilii]
MLCYWTRNIFALSEQVQQLWVLILHDGKTKMVEDYLAGTIELITPRLLGPFATIFSYQGFLDSKEILVEPIIRRQIEWLRIQIHALDKPFSWEMMKHKWEATNYIVNYNPDRKQVNASFIMEEGGCQTDPFVKITKTRSWYDKAKSKLPEMKNEIKGLMDRCGKYADCNTGNEMEK